MNELLNSALVASLPTRLAHKSVSGSPRLSAGAVGQSAEHQDQVIAKLLNLAGQSPGPSLCSTAGSFYEYDPLVGKTVENVPDGRRFLVGAASGGELVRLREVGQSPFLDAGKIGRR